MPEVLDTRAILDTYIWNGPRLEGTYPAFISYSFETTLPALLPVRNDYSEAFRQSFRPLTAAQQDAARQAFTQWDLASGLKFFEVPSGMGGIKLSSFNLDLGGEDLADSIAVFVGRFSPLSYAPRTAIFADLSMGADIDTFLHEIGHAIGLKHPFEGEFTLPYDDDHVGTTVMSYDYLPGQTGETLGTLDRQAIVGLYGTNAQDGTQVSAWRWDAAAATLHQTGHPGTDLIQGIGGRNVIDGADGDDLLLGADQHDVLRGGSGADFLAGLEGNDHLYGQSANGGEDGADTIQGGEGGDYIQGNAGTDSLLGGGGSDRIQGGRDDDGIDGGDGNDSMNGNLGNDRIDGGGGNDLLRGGQGNDSLTGGEGQDTLLGDLGDDVLIGGGGFDVMTGGPGADIFRFVGGDATSTASWLFDIVSDFADGVDKLQIYRVPGSIGRAIAASEEELGLLRHRFYVASEHEVMAVGLGATTHIFYRATDTGPGAPTGAAIALAGISPASIDLGDFI